MRFPAAAPLAVAALAALLPAACQKGGSPEAAAPAQSLQNRVAQGPIHGKVLEKIDATSYSYLRLSTAEGELWAAVPTAQVQVGAEVDLSGQMVVNDFESQTLGRKFKSLIFGTLGGAQAAKAQAIPPGWGPGTQAAPAGNPHAGLGGAAPGTNPHAGLGIPAPGAAGASARAAAEPVTGISRATGPGNHTVAELFAQRTALKDAEVEVRGKVVKYNEGILGKNWLHLRDGSGTAGKDDDLAVTTQSPVAVGDVVLVRGPVHLDRDFGAGYAYSLIVEDAKVTKQ